MGSLMEYRRRILLNTPHIESASGSVAHFTTDMAAKLKECKISFLPQQAGSGDPSPSNVRAISGWTGCDVVRSGKNIAQVLGYSTSTTPYPGATRSSTNASYGVTISTTDFTLPDTSVTITSSDPTKGYFAVCLDGMVFDQTYRVSFRITNITNNPNNYTLSDFRVISPGGIYSRVTVDGDRCVSVLNFIRSTGTPNSQDIRISGFAGMSFTLSEFMVTPVEDEDYTYSPYNPDQITVSWADLGMIYGGFIDVLRGELVATYEFKRIVGNESWHISSGISDLCAYRPTIRNFRPSTQGLYALPICDKLKGIAQQGTGVYQATIHPSGNFYFGAPEELSTSEAVNTWVQSIGGIDVAYELATPITYPLTPETIKAIKGVNNVFSDANGDVEVRFWTH